MTMPLTDAQQRAKNKYRKKFEHLQMEVSAEEKTQIVNHAAGCGESLNAFLRRAARETIERDNAKKLSQGNN